VAAVFLADHALPTSLPDWRGYLMSLFAAGMDIERLHGRFCARASGYPP